MTMYEFDTTLDPNYPVLTRGNAGEIMPDIVSPLSATVFFPPLERGWRRSFTETWDVMDWPDCPTTFAPIVGGRFYINISAFRRLADLTPGTSPEDIDRTLFAAGGIRLDPYEAPDEDGYAERGERIAAATASFLADPPLERLQREHDAAQARRVEGRAKRHDQLERGAARSVRVDAAVDGVRLRQPVHRIVGQPCGVRFTAGGPRRDLRRRGLRARSAIGDGHRRDRVGRGRQGGRLARRARGRRVRSGVREGARTVRIPRRERVGDRGTVVGDPTGRSASRRRRREGRWRRARPRRDPQGGAGEVRGGRSPDPVRRARSVAGALQGLARRARADEGHLCADHQRDAARRARDRSTTCRRWQVGVGRSDLLPHVRRVPLRRSRW